MYFSIKFWEFCNFGANQIYTELLKPARFVFCIIILVITSMLCFSSFLTISYCFLLCFQIFPFLFLQFPWVFLLFPFSFSPVTYFRFCNLNSDNCSYFVQFWNREICNPTIKNKFFCSTFKNSFLKSKRNSKKKTRKTKNRKTRKITRNRNRMNKKRKTRKNRRRNNEKS